RKKAAIKAAFFHAVGQTLRFRSEPEFAQDLDLASCCHRFAVIRRVLDLVLLLIFAVCLARPLRHIAQEPERYKQADKGERDTNKGFDRFHTVDTAKRREHQRDNRKNSSPEQLERDRRLCILIAALDAHTRQRHRHGIALGNQRDGNNEQHYNLRYGTQWQHVEHGQRQGLRAALLVERVKINAFENLRVQ